MIDDNFINQQKNVLFIDDDEIIRTIVSEILSSGGYVVQTATDGKSGLETFDSQPSDIVVTDIVMPEMSGLEVLRVIKKTSPWTPVIVLSGDGGLEDVKLALKLGAYDYLTKSEPAIDPESLIAAVNRAWEKLQLTRENEAYRKNLEVRVAERTQELQNANERIRREKQISDDVKLEAFRKIERSERKYKTLISEVPSGIATVTGTYITASNNMFADILGFGSDDQSLMGDTSDNKTFVEAGFTDRILDCLERKQPYSDEKPYCGPDNKERFIRYTLTPIQLDEHGFEVEVLFTVEDITLETAEKERLAEEASRDGLTGLIIQNKFNDRLTDTIQGSKIDKFPIAVIHIDIDDFGTINTNYGHPVASEVLRLVGQRIINSTCGRRDSGFRVGGDEFAVICTRYSSGALEIMIQRLFNKLSEVYSVGLSGKEHIIKCTFSIGVSEYSEEKDQNAETLYTESDKATYEAKDRGKCRYIFYNSMA